MFVIWEAAGAERISARLPLSWVRVPGFSLRFTEKTGGGEMIDLKAVLRWLWLAAMIFLILVLSGRA